MRDSDYQIRPYRILITAYCRAGCLLPAVDFSRFCGGLWASRPTHFLKSNCIIRAEIYTNNYFEFLIPHSELKTGKSNAHP